MAIVQNHRLEYEMSSIKVNYPDIGEVTYNGSSPIIVPNNWQPVSKPSVKKGDLIIMDGKQYRVLKVDDTVAEVFCLYTAATAILFGNNNTYENSNLDTYCNDTFYAILSDNIQNAIIDKTFVQDKWTFGSTPESDTYYTGLDYQGDPCYYSLLDNAYGSLITRRCYSISVQDIFDYFECTPAEDPNESPVTSANLGLVFWNTSTFLGSENNPYLRSAVPATNEITYLTHSSIDGAVYNGISSAHMRYFADVRPAFQIDLSKVEFTKE